MYLTKLIRILVSRNSNFKVEEKLLFWKRIEQKLRSENEVPTRKCDFDAAIMHGD